MRILLINPPAKNTIIGNNPPIIDEERGYNPPLGILFIAAYLLDNSEHEIKVIDAQVEEMDYERLKEAIKDFGPDVAGITAMSFTLVDVLKVAKIVKEIDSATLIVLGGPHVNIFPDETINMPEIDFLVLGEGEEVFQKLVDNIRNKDKLRSVKGLVFKDSGEIVNTGSRGLIENLDALPFPARQLVPYQKYTSLMAKRNPVTTTFTSRGCPYRCLFCDRPHLGKVFRARSAKNVVDEMGQCAKMGIREFLVYDDTFTVDRERVLSVCDEILKRKLDIGWDIRARIDTMDREMLEKLHEAHCERIHYGVEAGNDRVLKVLRKGITVSQVREVFKMTKEVGIATLAYFMIGSPTETKAEIKQTIDLAKSLNPDYVHITIFTPFPATDAYRLGLKQGIIKQDYWREFARNPSTDFHPPYWEENFKSEELRDMIVTAYQEFYTRPSYILKNLFKIRSLPEFKRKARAGLKVFTMNK